MEILSINEWTERKNLNEGLKKSKTTPGVYIGTPLFERVNQEVHDMLIANRRFFERSNFKIVKNSHADYGLGCYICTPEIAMNLHNTDNFSTYFETMGEYYAELDSGKYNTSATWEKGEGKHKTSWYVIFDKTDDSFVGVISATERHIIEGEDDDHLITETPRYPSLYYIDKANPNFQTVVHHRNSRDTQHKVLEYWLARYETMKINHKKLGHLL